MISIDLTDAYFSLPIAKRSRKFLRFQWRDMLLEFQCLCFGLSLAPYFFTKVMKPVFSRLECSCDLECSCVTAVFAKLERK